MTYSELLDAFAGKRALIVGDLMLDEYHFGSAERISPEAPVMVIRHQRSTHVPGGAANVALNLKAMGGEPILVGVVGQDADGDRLEAALRESGLSEVHVLRDPGRPTTKKTRIVADHAHQVLRVDFESAGSVDGAIEAGLMDIARRECSAAHVLLLSDYLKGVCTPTVSAGAIDAARAASIPVVANPKPQSLRQYRGATLVSLNLKEATEALVPAGLLAADSNLETAAYLAEVGFGALLVTRGGDGMAISGPISLRVPAPKVEVYDTAGAGDTVIATVALGLAAAGFRREVFELAAQTAACVVRHVGVATPSQADLAAIREM